MMRILFGIGGVALLILGVARIVGLLQLLRDGPAASSPFVIKQAAYTIALIGGGVGLLAAARGSRKGGGVSEV